jgi:hypothetical protein
MPGIKPDDPRDTAPPAFGTARLPPWRRGNRPAGRPPPDADPGKTRRPDHRRGAAATLADRGQIATPTDGPATGAKAPGREGWPVRLPLTLPGEPVSRIAPTVAFFLSWWLSRSYVHDRNRDRARPG